MEDSPRDILEAQRASLSAHCAAAVDSAVSTIFGATHASWASITPKIVVTTNEDSLPGRPLYESFARAQAQETQSTTELLICFHGTASRNIGPICREGLDASKRGSAYGQKLGAGEYFAEYLPVAMQYAMRHRQLGGVNDQVLVFAVLVRSGEVSDRRGSWGRIFVIADPARTLPLGILTVAQHAEEIVLQWPRAFRLARATPYLRQGETPQQQLEREQLEHKKKVDRMFKHLGERRHRQSGPLAVPQLGSCASSGRAWRLWAARHSQEEAGPLGAQSLPRMLELAASDAADFTALDHPGHGPRRRLGHMAGAARGARRRPAGLRRAGGPAAGHWATSSPIALALALASTLAPKPEPNPSSTLTQPNPEPQP